MNTIPEKPSICFGIPSLDDLFGTFSLSHRAYGIPVESVGTEHPSTNLTLVGPDGSGKSLLAFHLASRYAADSFSRAKRRPGEGNSWVPPIIIHISTDLSLAKAESTWTSFRLDRPNLREIPFYHGTVESKESLKVDADEIDLQVRILPLDPAHEEKQGESESLANYIIEGSAARRETSVGFIDLIRYPVGDLWSFTSRLLASLPESKAPDQHLVIIDNVDGFEVWMGEVNAYGDRSSVRARIMQVMRMATGKAHLLFVSQEGGTGAAPLCDVSDVVIRLHLKEEYGYKYRSIEIEKARAQAIHRGEHYLMIRTGGGSTTGTQENPDDPRTANAYMQVIPSLSTLSRRSMNEPKGLNAGPPVSQKRRAGFGLPALDELCGSAESERGVLENDAAGIKCGTLSAILGDSNTHKTQLGQKFILRGFELFAENLSALYENWSGHQNLAETKIWQLAQAIAGARESRENASSGDSGAGFPNGLLQKLGAQPEQQCSFLTQLLLQARYGAEPALEPEKLAKEIENSVTSGALSPALALFCGSWVARILKNRLKELLEQGGETASKELVEACLPVAVWGAPFCEMLWTPGKRISRDEMLEAALDVWWQDFAAFSEDQNAPSLSDQYRIRGDYMADKVAKSELVQEVIASRRSNKRAHAAAASIGIAVREREQPPEDRASAEKERQDLRERHKSRWKSKNAVEFLEERFWGSSDYLTPDQRSHLENIKKLDDTQFSLEPEEVKRVFIGVAIRNIESYRQKPAELQNWLSRLNIWVGKEPTSYLSFAEKLLEFARRHATRSDLVAMHEVVRNLEPEERVEKRNLASILKQFVPHLPDYARLEKDETSAQEFTNWLFEFSPTTHPYASTSGKQALQKDLELLREEPGNRKESTPIFCSVMVSAVLHLIRLGKLSFGGESHLEDELRARRKASESVDDLQAWVETHISCENTDEPGVACKAAITELCKRIQEGRVGASDLKSFVKELSRRRGVDVDVNKMAPELKEKAPQICRLLLEAAARCGLCDGPAVLITTNDTRWQLFRDKYRTWLNDFLKQKGYSGKTLEALQHVAEDHLREWLIIRRLEVHYVATATLSAIVRRCAIAAQGLMFASPAITNGNGGTPGGKTQDWMADINTRRERSWNIRLVIDGLTTLRNTYPNVESDRLFLPSLRFYIGWENLTGIVVVSQSGRPDSEGADQFERETVDLFLNQIRTWRVRFYGELRVAVTILPPPPEQGSARIREILAGRDGELQIDPHFEIYKGLENDTPERVGLEVRLIGDSAVWQTYRKELNDVFADVFAAADPVNRPKQVALADGSPGWTEKLRDFARLHRGTRLDQTLILQVDEFWGFRRSEALRNEYRFLTAECDNRGSGENDLLEMFPATLADPEPIPASRRRRKFLWNGYYRAGEEPCTQSERESLDRIPFLWDFGFMLCNREAWEAARGEKLRITEKNYCTWKDSAGIGSVDDIWQSFRKIPSLERNGGAEGAAAYVAHRDLTEQRALSSRSWRLFMEAAAATAAHHGLSTAHPGPAFDLAVRGGESLCCLILEIWASEVYRKFERISRNPRDLYFDRFTKRSWAPALTRGLIGLIAEPESGGGLKRIYGKALARGRLPQLSRHSLELFKALLLIREGLDISSFMDAKQSANLDTRPVNSDAVAARHWYGTASEFFENSPGADRFIPVRLPGHFSVRGDWYLAVAKGSHSSLLADRALDLLSSRRGNFDRLRLGLGLPVRDAESRSEDNPQTRLTVSLQNGRKHRVRYKELTGLGADHAEDERFYWLWRSSLGDYDSQDRAFQQGVLLLLNWWRGLETTRAHDWKTGFHLYDAIDLYQSITDENKKKEIFDEYFAVNSLWEFPEICDELVWSLKRATPRR